MLWGHDTAHSTAETCGGGNSFSVTHETTEHREIFWISGNVLLTNRGGQLLGAGAGLFILMLIGWHVN